MAMLFLSTLVFPAGEASDSSQLSVPRTPGDASSKFAVGFGIPELLSIGYAKKIDSKIWIGASVGAIPLGTFLGVLSVQATNSFSDAYTINVEPRAYAFSSGLSVEYHPWGGEGHFKLQGNILLANVMETALLQNIGTGNSTPVASIDFTLFQPVISLKYGSSIYRGEGWNLGWELGVSYFFSVSLKTSLYGSLPSYLQVAPEYQSSISYGLTDAQAEISRVVNALNVKPAFLPAFLIYANF
jgi:hypothetical protein